jgi:hypothetical protein
MDSRLKCHCANFIYLFISDDAAQEKEKKEKKGLLPTGVSKSAAHTVKLCEFSPSSNMG